MPARARSSIAEAGAAGILLALLAATPAAAQLALCNRTSFVLEAAIAFEQAGTAATRGWFRLDPGQCRAALSGGVPAERLLVHARADPVYGRDPFAQAGHRDLCVGEGEFLIAGAQTCAGDRRRLAPFTEVRPRETDAGAAVALAEEADYSPEAARLAGIQRLLALAGHDAGAVDGVAGPKTDAALAQALRAQGLAPETAGQPAVFAALIAMAGADSGRGFAWCNRTSFAAMAALGHEERGVIVTRGWWRVEPGKCLRPELDRRDHRRLWSFAEAVDVDGTPVTRGGKPLSWGGTTTLCTRPARFELRAHKDCAGQGLEPKGFAPVDLSGKPSVTIGFAER